MFDNIKAVLTPFNGFLVWSAGKYKIKVLKDEAILLDVNGEEFTFQESNIIGDISMELGSKENMANRVKARFYNAGLNYSEDIAIYEDDELRVRRDNGEWLELELSLPFCSDYTRALMLSKQFLEQTRRGTIVSFNATPDALQAQIGDRVWFSHPYLGFQDDYRVMGMVMNPDKTITVTLQQYDDAIYSVADIAALPGPLTQERNNKFNGSDFGAVSAAPTTVQYWSYCPEDNILGLLSGSKISWTAPNFPNISHYEVVITTSAAVKSLTTSDTFFIIPGLALAAIVTSMGGTFTNFKVRAVSTDGTLGTLSSAASLITNPDAGTLCGLTPPSEITHWQICDGANGASAAEKMGVALTVTGDGAQISGPGVHKMKAKWKHGPSVADFVSYKMRFSSYIMPVGYVISASTNADPPPGSVIIKDVTETVAKTPGAISTDYQEYTFSALVTEPASSFVYNVTLDENGVAYSSPVDRMWRSVQVAGVTSSGTEVWQYDESFAINPDNATECFFNPPNDLDLFQVCDGAGGASAAHTFTVPFGGGPWYIESGGTAHIGFKIQHGYDHAITDKYVVAFEWVVNDQIVSTFTEEVTRDPASTYLGYQYYTSTAVVDFNAFDGLAFQSGYVRAKRTTGNILSQPYIQTTRIANPTAGTTCQ